LALSLVFFLTLQCGFFNRRQHEKLLREKRESAGLPLSDDEVLNACLENGGDDKTDPPRIGVQTTAAASCGSTTLTVGRHVIPVNTTTVKRNPYRRLTTTRSMSVDLGAREKY
jgi:hypothetical protein